MSKKYGIFCENCNVLLNNEDKIFGTNFGHLYHSTCMGGITHGKSTDCQPLMLFKMNLKFADTPTLTTETEREIMELKNSNNAARQYVQQLEAKIKTLEDALLVKDRLKDDISKIMDYVVKLGNPSPINVLDKSTDVVNNTSQDKFNKKANDENNLNGDDSSLTEEADKQNIEPKDSNNGELQSAQQLEARTKTLQGALLQIKSDGNKLTERVETVEKNKTVEKTPDRGNNITQGSNANKETNNASDLSDEQQNDTENVASASEEHHTCTISEETQEVLDLRRNCVYIDNANRCCRTLDEAFSYVRKLANEMYVHIADNSVIHIDIDYSTLYVYFRDADSKTKFLTYSGCYNYNPNTEDYLRILDYTDCGIVDIANVSSYDLCSNTHYNIVLGLAQKMGMTNIKNFIKRIDVYSIAPNCYRYSVTFTSEYIKNVFLQKKDILKQFPETKSLIIKNLGGHTSSQYNVNNFSMAAANANVIGIAELMGLSLSTDNVKRINVLNVKKFSYNDGDLQVSLVVEFSNNDLKNKFLNKKSELKRILKDWSSCIRISDIETERADIVSIKYYKVESGMFTAISFIGLAKQLGFSFAPDQTDRFIQLSQFVWNAFS